MNKEIIEAPSISPAVISETPGIVNNGLLVGANNGNINTTTYTSDIFRTCLPLGFVGRRDCYSVLICDYDDDNAFILRYSGTKTTFEDKRTPQKFIDRFTPFSKDKMNALMRVPVIVMKPNKSKSPSGTALFGYLTTIEQGSPIQMRFFLLAQIPVSALVPHFDTLQIKHTDLWNELHEERWNIKEGNIFDILEEAEINLPEL